MKRRSKGGGKTGKAGRHKAATPKRRNAPTTLHGRSSKSEFARLSRELNEALERETATAQILASIRGSPRETRPVFEAILGNLLRLFGTRLAAIFLVRDGMVHVAGLKGYPGFEKFAELFPLPLDDRLLVGRAILAGRALQIVPIVGNSEASPLTQKMAADFGFNALLSAPLSHEGKVIGAINTAHRNPVAFTDKQFALIKSFADQAVIAIENTRHLSELRESLEHQTATSEVLHVISSSTFDLERVFNTLLETAMRLCESNIAALWRRDGDCLRLTTCRGVSTEFEKFARENPLKIDRASTSSRAALEGRTIHIPDVLADPEVTATGYQAHGKYRTALSVPLLREGEVVGVFALARSEVKPYADTQIELVQNFAAQAVVAIENTRLLNELRKRTDDLSESLEQQTATSEVLRVISTSPGDLEPVFESILENAVRICNANFGSIYRWDGEALHLVAAHRNTPPAFAQARRNAPQNPSKRPNPVIRAMLATEAPVEVDDVAATAGYIDRSDFQAVTAVELGGIRTALAVPMLREHELVGSFTVYRQEVRPFTEKQIELLKNFAAQAVIAIENTRLLNELRESLQQQTATAEVLSVISSSPGALEPVFNAMLESATRICGASFGNLDLREGEVFRHAAMYNAPPAFAEQRRRAPILHLNPRAALSRVVAEKRFVQIEDMAEHPSYKEQASQAVDLVEKGKARTLLLAPLLKEDEVVGLFAIYRQEVRPFTDKQIALVENFAAQAVIAIENARLLRELSRENRRG